jgi:hypothetical protein
MKGKTLRIDSAEFRQAVQLDSGAVLLISRDSKPHRWCADMNEAKEAGRFTTTANWSDGTDSADDQWPGVVTFEDVGVIKARSEAFYGVVDPLPREPAAPAMASAPLPDREADRLAELEARKADAEAAKAEADARKAEADARALEARLELAKLEAAKPAS